MPIAAKIIMGFIVFYGTAFYLIRYIIDYFLYRHEKKKQKTGPPRAYYSPLHKPTFFNN